MNPWAFSIMDTEFFIRLCINLLSLFVLVRLLYYRKSPNRDFLFTFYLFGFVVFIITRVLHNVEISMGFAFGLFAVFTMLRYRTESISIKEMTFLFIVIGVALLNAVAGFSYVELAIVNFLIMFMTLFADSTALHPLLDEKKIQYEKIENIKPRDRLILIEDLKARTGLDIRHVEVGKIDFLRDTANLKVFYVKNGHRPS
jgi:hypothetical protein